MCKSKNVKGNNFFGLEPKKETKRKRIVRAGAYKSRKGKSLPFEPVLIHLFHITPNFRLKGNSAVQTILHGTIDCLQAAYSPL